MTRTVRLLLVEDSLGDVELVRLGLARAKVEHALTVASDGVEALEVLAGNEADGDRPDLVLLDINLPRMNGHEVLQFIREHEQLRSMPVAILTTSTHDDDVLRAFEHQANAFLQKPLRPEAFLDLLSRLDVDRAD